jgi:hypothetical protein
MKMSPEHPIHIEVIDDTLAAIYRNMSGSQRLRIASDMYASARKMLMNHLRTIHPDWNESEITRETARRLSHGTCRVAETTD